MKRPEIDDREVLTRFFRMDLDQNHFLDQTEWEAHAEVFSRAQNAILGGGRYDGLSESLGGPPAPGIGFAIGEDRLVMSLQETAPAESVLRRPDVYIAPMAGMNSYAALLARELRRHDVVLELGDDSFRLKKSFEAATKAQSKYILIVGENEVKADAFALKNLASGEQLSVPRAELVQRIRGE